MNINRAESQNQAHQHYIKNLKKIYSKREKNMHWRYVEFLKKNDNERLEAIKITAISAMAGLGTGMIFGGIIGGCIGSPGGPPGIALGAGIGGGIGLGIGLLVAAIGTPISQYDEYDKWRKTETGKEFAHDITLLIEEDFFQKELICPITQMPIVNGVRTPDGQLYEKKAIEEWVRKNGNNPLTRERLRKSDLKIDPKATLESSKQFLKFIKQNRDLTKEHAPKIINGYDALIKEIQSNLINIHNVKLIEAQKKFEKGDITFEKLHEKTEKLFKKYMQL